MQLPLADVSDCELHTIIRFFTAKGFSGSSIHEELVSALGVQCMSVQILHQWRDSLVNGRANVHDEQRSGRLLTATDDTKGLDNGGHYIGK